MDRMTQAVRRPPSARTAIATIALALLIAVAASPAANASGGTAMGWGQNGYAEVGTGSGSMGGCFCIATPVPVVGLSGVTQILGGEGFSLALLSDGTVRSWGYNAYGQLGDGTTTESPTPAPPVGLTNVIALASGESHGLALLSNGTVMAWGDNESGQLGSGGVEGPEKCELVPCRKTPALVPGLTNVVAIAAGGDFNLALLANGTVMAWGYDSYGQVGDGVGVQAGCHCVDHPVAVPGVSNAIAISASGSFGEALLQDGTVRTWGENYYGQLGIGIRTETPKCYCFGPVQPTGLTGVKAVAAGAFFDIALLSDGTARGWGHNDYGQLGNETTTIGGCDCVLAIGPVLGLSGVQAISSGYYFAMALLADGTARAWGESSYGQLGTGTLEEKSLPVPIKGVSGASAIGAREFGGYAIIGPSQTLSVSLAGAGSGTVGGGDIACPPNCTGRHPQGQVNILRAAAAPGSGFAGFSGPCTGTGTCQVKMEADQTVTATFGPPKGTAITRSKIQSPKRKATFSFSAPGVITGFECLLAKKANRKARTHSRVALKTRSKPRFAGCSGPKIYRKLKPGRYTFRVRALDILGADANPAVKKFTIKKPRKRKARH
jgi:alpha-tubulin suppressor-like RCC1 family protein